MSKFKKTVKILKKCGKIIGEVTGKKSNNNTCKINKLSSAGLTITGSRNIANEFNTFFCNVGEKIANDVEDTNYRHEDFLREPAPTTLPMEFGTFTQAEFISIINNMDPKSSMDIDGISNNLIKFVKFENFCPACPFVQPEL
jgi:hypothetical protein